MLIIHHFRMKIGLVRRGYSPSGGAERYLLRFAEALRVAGHEAVLFGSGEWPAEAWKGEFVRVEGDGPREFADGLRTARPREHCDAAVLAGAGVGVRRLPGGGWGAPGVAGPAAGV